ncbi:GumC family protein [Pedobacter mucosus]|uniref:GumC family protein n=1 Tax=Pedobacter mucosus TaxID=2895286 RepID=UPI001EE3F5A0|nr:polysaccharide biosynthesis tyrosine autokinase [Pedobacter mucosus]UKT62397.1 polysaccharide biosynthesis tyrosine autokinase [Pedobacter mucosus]
MSLIRKTTETNTPGNSKGLMIFKLLPYWPFFLILFGIAILGAYLYLQITPVAYETNARIQINERKGSSEISTPAEPMQDVKQKKTVDNEREVIISTPILGKVVQDLSLYATVYIKKGLSTKTLYKNSPIKIIVQNPDKIVPQDKISFTYSDKGVIISGKTYTYLTWYRMPYGTIRFKKTGSKSTSGEDKLSFSLTPLKSVVQSISERLTVTEANKLSTILNVSFLDEDPTRAEDILNTTLKAYANAGIEEDNKLAANTLQFINQRLAGVENELIAIESQQQNYQASRGAIDIGTQGKLYLENVSVNDQKVGEINMQLSVLDQVEKYVRSKDLSAGIVPSTAGINDPSLTDMVKDIYQLQLNAEGLKKTTGENNPLYVTYTDQIQSIKPQIIQNLRNQRNSLNASKANLSSTTNNYSSALQSMPETQRKLVDIDREQQIKSGIYTFLLKKKEETALSYITNGSDSKIVSGAISSEFPVSPKRKMVYLASLLGAGILGIGFVSVKEGLRRNVMFQKDIEELTSLPVIAEISSNPKKANIVTGSKERTLIAEQFRSLRTTLRYLGVDTSKKRIMVTSAIPGEGKSFIASNLAITLSMSGKKVALLDFDLNHPSIHHKFGLKQSAGITEYLEGSATLEDIKIQPTKFENLTIMLTGSLPDDPAELIMNGRAQKLLDELQDDYDFIIIDVPPVGPVSDAYTIAPLCDATLFVIRHAYTPKIFVERIDENIKLNNLPSPGIVFNAVAQRGYGKNNYGYGYGSGMVYGGSYDRKLISKTGQINE